MVTLVNRAKVATSTTGVGSVSLGAAEDGYQTFSAAGLTGGETIRYTIEDGDAWEIGTGGINGAVSQMTRTLIESSTGSKLNLSGNAVVYVTAAGQDIVQPSDLATVATTGDYDDLTGKPTLGTAAAADTGDFATAAQGTLADSALQSGDNVSTLTNDAGYTTNVGDITGVTAGTNLTGGGTSGAVTLNVSASPTFTNVTATSFSGDGSSLTGISASATGGGSDEIFWENGQNVTTDYTITNGKNAMSAGPITVNSGVTVTVGAGETWTVV